MFLSLSDFSLTGLFCLFYNFLGMFFTAETF